VVKIPRKLSYDLAAATEPLACAVYAVNNLNVEKGHFVVVFGPGPVGLMMVQLAKLRKAGKVMLVGTRDYRLEKGKQLGADIIVNTMDPQSPYYVRDLAARIRDENDGQLADRAITSTSSLEAIHLALAITGKHSTVVIFGLPGDKDVIQVPALQTILMDKTIRYSWLAPNTWPEAVNLIAAGKVKVEPLQSHRFELDDLVEAIQKVRAREDKCLKALIKVDEN
jgi:threonine dehydrogenase-like Zn-dependent dehydrogenase